MLHRQGFGRTALAAALGISPGTVKVALRQIRWRLGPNWQSNPEYVWPDDWPRRPEAERNRQPATLASCEQPPGARPFAAEEAAGGAVPDWRYLEFTGLQRFWLKPVLDRLVEDGALRFVSAGKEGVFAPPWLPVAYHRSSVRPAVYRVRDAEAVFKELAGFLETGLPRRAAEVLERVQRAGSLRGPWRQSELPGPAVLAALLREAFGGAGEKAAARLEALSEVGKQQVTNERGGN